MDKKAQLKGVLDAFENGKADLQLTLTRINQLTGKNIDAHEIIEYWSYTSLDELCDRLLAEPIVHWETIDDDKALLLIEEILDNTTNDFIININSYSLEKMYIKATGFISELIMLSDITDRFEILAQLKKDTTIYL